MQTREDDPIRARVLAVLERYGHNTTSFQVLEPGLSYWFDEDDSAVVAYADTGGAWVVAGAPIAAHEREHEVGARFIAHARRHRKRVRFFGVEREHITSAGLKLMHMGEQPVWEPEEWPLALRGKRSLREQLRRARAKGVTVRRASREELLDSDGAVRRDANQLIARWKNSRAMAPMGFVVQIDLYTFVDERRVFLAERDGAVVGLLAAVPIYARNGWFFEDVLRCPDSPNGTMELLFDHAMRAAHQAGIKHVTYGLAPLANTPSRAMATIRDSTRWLYHFDGLRAFKAKLMPQSWHPVYLAYPDKERGVRAVIDVLSAFAGGSLWRFGMATLRHNAVLVTQILAWLLVPWTLAMAFSDTAHWFPSPAAKIGWIAYDALLFVALLGLARNWRRSRALLLVGAALADVGIGCIQAATYNIPRVHSLSDAAIIVLALAAPLFAAVYLWACRDHIDLYREPGSHETSATTT